MKTVGKENQQLITYCEATIQANTLAPQIIPFSTMLIYYKPRCGSLKKNEKTKLQK